MASKHEYSFSQVNFDVEYNNLYMEKGIKVILGNLK